MKNLSKVLLIGVIAASVVVPSLALAQLKCPDGTPIGPNGCQLTSSSITDIGKVVPLLNTITNWLFTFLMIFAVIMFIWAAYLYLFSGGSEESTGKAKGLLIYGVIGIAVAMLSKGITFIVYQLLK